MVTFILTIFTYVSSLTSLSLLCLDSPWASPCGTENEGPFINKVCSTRETPLPQRHEETQVALELPILGRCSSLQGSQNQSSELGHSLVISLAAVKDAIQEDSQVSQKISEIGTHGEFMASKKHQLLVAQHQSEVEPLEKEQSSMVPQQCQSEGETSVNEQTDVTLQQFADVHSTQDQLAQLASLNKVEACDELQNGVANFEASSQSDLVRLRRGRPPKKVKHPQRPVKEILQSQSSVFPTLNVEEAEVSSAVDIVNTTSSKSPQACPAQPKESSSIITPSSRERANTALEDVENSKVGSLALSLAAQQLSMNVERGAIQATSTAVTQNTPPTDSPQAPSVQPRECHTSVTLQDAMLLVEAMYQSMSENVFSSRHRTVAPIQTQCAPSAVAQQQQTVGTAPAELQTLPHPVETHDAVHTIPITELPSTTQSTIEKLSAPSETVDVAPTNEALAHIMAVIPKQQHTVPVSSATISSMPPSTQTSVQSLQQHHPYPLITSVAPSRRGKTVPHKIIVMPRSTSSIKPHKPAEQSPTQLPTVTPRVVAAPYNSILQGSTAVDLPLGTPSSSSVPDKTIFVTSSKLLPVVTMSTTTSTDLQSVTQVHPKITTIVPRQESQTIVQTTQQESTKSDAPAVLPTSQFMSSSQELSFSVETQTASDEVPTISCQKKHNTSDNLESPKQTASVSETVNAHSQTYSSFNMSVGLAGPPTLKQKLSAVVKLTRLSFPISAKESVLVSRLPTSACCDCQSIWKPGITQEKASSIVTLTQPSKTADIYTSLKETSVAVPVNTPQMSEEQNDVEEKVPVSSENCITLEELPNGTYVQQSTSSNVSQPVFEKTIAINTTEPSAVSRTAGEPTSSLKEEIISITVQNCALPNDRPTEEKQSATLTNLTSITSKDTADPHLMMSKSQFLEQLAVSPAAQDLEKVMQL